MKAVTWQGFRDISVEEVADPVIKEPNDAIIKVTSTNICGSDLHLYETMGAFMSPGDVLGHEAIGIVLEVGRDITQIRPGDRVVVPFQISCGHCWMCDRFLYTQCEKTQCAGKAAVPRCSATRSCTARSQAVRPNICECRSAVHPHLGAGGTI